MMDGWMDREEILRSMLHHTYHQTRSLFIGSCWVRVRGLPTIHSPLLALLVCSFPSLVSLTFNDNDTKQTPSTTCAVKHPRPSTSSKNSACLFPEPKKERFTNEPLEDSHSNSAREDKRTVVPPPPTAPDTPCCTLSTDVPSPLIPHTLSNTLPLILSWMTTEPASASWP